MTNEQWQQVVEEFGDRAHDRVFVSCGEDSFSPLSNNEALDNLDALKFIYPPYLFEHGVLIYGFEAEKKMWEWLFRDKWLNVTESASYEEILCGMAEYEHRRKTSAALPFDLERAKAGDVVEINLLSGWERCKFEAFDNCKHPLIKLDNISVSEFNLRMKYPPKKLVLNCQTCQFTDVCEQASVQHEKLLPLTQRGDKPACFECGHRYWNINNVTHVHKCLDCEHTVSGISVEIKHQR